MAFLDLLNQMSGLIIAIGAVVAAGDKIFRPLWSGYTFTKKGIKKKTKEKIDESVKESLETNYANILKSDTATIEQKLDAVKESEECILTRLVSIEDQLIFLRDCNKDLLRSEMNTIYHTYLPYETILEFDKEDFEHLYEDYKALGGNSYVEDMRNVLRGWKTVCSPTEIPGYLNK